MDYSSGGTYGYDQIQPNMLVDNYDAPYTPSATNGAVPSCVNQTGHRTMLPPPRYNVERPIMSLADSIDKVRRPMDSTLIGRPHPKECFGSGGPEFRQLDMDGILLLFIFVLIIVVVINSISLRHLAKQVKMLTRREMAASPTIAK